MLWFNREDRRSTANEALERQALREVSELISQIGEEDLELGRLADALAALADRR